MGFDNECILNIQNLPGEYFCPICRTLVYPDEALQSQCTHLYCKPCLAYVVGTTRACPYDGYLVTEADSKPLTESNKSIAEAIGKVPVYCLYHRSGCQWQGTLSECTAHCPECSYGNCPVICNRCGMHIIHRQVQEHAHSCPTLQSQPQQLDSALTQVSAGQSEIINEASSTASTSTAMSAPSSTSTAMPVVSSTPSGQTVASTAFTSAAAASDSTPVASSDQAALTQAASIAQPQVPPAEQWYQQQQMQYQQYYQQYPGYDPYQQQYQHYGQYQQQVHQQYPQAYLQAPVQHVVQGQQQPIHTMQPQPLSQPHSQLSMQNQQLALQIQPQGQTAQPQAQPPPQVLTAQPQTQQQHYPQLPQQPQQPQPHSHVPAQQLLPQTQPQNHPPPYTQMARQLQTQPHPHAQPPQFTTQPNPQLSKSMPPQSHLHSQMPQPQPPRQQPHMQQQSHSQPHLRPQGQPILQSQPQQPAAQAVTGHQSYPQPYPFQPAPSGVAQQRPMHMHPQHLQAPVQPVQYTGHMHNQFPPQQNQMRPPTNSVPGQAQQIGMLPPQSSRGSAIPSLQPGQQFHHHAGMQPQQIVPHHQAQGQLHPTQQYQQGPYSQQPIRSQAPTLQQSVPTQPVAHGVTSYQAQVPAPGPAIISHGTPQQASQQISTQYPSESNLAASSEVKSGTMQHTQVTPSQCSLPPQPSGLQSGEAIDQNQASAAKESSRLIAPELQGKSSPDKGAQVHKLEAEMEQKNSKGADLALTKMPSEYVAISVHEGKANADSRGSNQSNSDGKVVQESAHVRSAQSDNLDVQVAEHATDKVSHFTNDSKEVSELSAAQGDMLSNGAGRVQSLPDSRESLSSSQSKEQVPIADVQQGISPAGSFPCEKYDHQNYGISPSMSEQAMNSQRASAPDRMVPQHMQLLDPPFVQSQMRPPVHNIPESRPPQGLGRQPYGSYLNEVPKAGHLGSFSNYSSSTGALGQNPLPANGPPAGVFAAAGGMTSNLPPGLESQTGQPRHTNVINGDHSKGHASGTERFGSRPFSEERFQSTVQDPYRRATSQGELEEEFKRFPKSTHSESESLPKFDGHLSSSWPAEGSRPLGGAFPPNSSGSTLLPMREHHKPGGIQDEWGRRPDALGAIPGAGNHLVGGLASLRSPGREYTGFEMRKFGFSKQGTDHFGQEPLNFGERSHAHNMPSDSFSGSFLDSRFPRPYAPGPTSFPGGSSDGPQHMRMMDQLASRNFPGDSGNELDGPAMHPSHFRHLRSNEAFGRSHLHFGDPGGFGGLHRDTRMGERGFPGHFPPHARESTGYLPVHMRSGESGRAHGYSMHGFPNETGRFGLVSNFDEIDSFGHSSKRNLASIGWCRLCKIDCGSVEGLDIHSQTREHQKMAMDIVLNIKQENLKKKKKALDDGTAIEGPSKSRKVKF